MFILYDAIKIFLIFALANVMRKLYDNRNKIQGRIYFGILLGGNEGYIDSKRTSCSFIMICALIFGVEITTDFLFFKRKPIVQIQYIYHFR